MITIRERFFGSRTQDSTTPATTFWKGRLLKYVGLFLLLGVPLTLAAWQGATTVHTTQPSPGKVSVTQPSTEVQGMDPNQSSSHSQSQSGNSSSSNVRVETNLHTSTSSGASSANQGSTSTSVTINGQNVSLPPNGQLHRKITAPDGSVSSVDISVGGNGTSSSSSVHVNVDGSSANSSN